MKRILLIAVLILIVVGVSVGMAEHEIDTRDYLRIHIRANSNSEADQSVKYAVKGRIVNVLSPKLREAKTSEDAQRIISENMPLIERTANEMLASSNMKYTAHAEIRREHFPVRHYGNVTLSEGDYDALIVELGEARGDNWWCVAFPPLCFVESEEVGSGEFHYISKIKELLDRLK